MTLLPSTAPMDDPAREIAELQQAQRGLQRIIAEQAEELQRWRREGGQALVENQELHHTLHRRNVEVEELRAGYAEAHHMLHQRNLEIEQLRAAVAEAHAALRARNLEVDTLQGTIAQTARLAVTSTRPWPIRLWHRVRRLA